MGITTKTYITVDIVKNESNELIKSPIKNLLPLIVKLNAEKSGVPPKIPIIGVITSFTRAVTTAPKDTPTTTPTAKSTTLPFKINFLKP